MLPAARLTGLGESSLNMHEYLCLANSRLVPDPTTSCNGERISRDSLAIIYSSSVQKSTWQIVLGLGVGAPVVCNS